LLEGGKSLEPECVGELKQIRRSLLEDYELTPELASACKTELEQQCEKVPRRQTIHCLMDLARPSKGRNVAKKRVSGECQAEVNLCQMKLYHFIHQP
jgi:Cysteine rich repeat